MDSFTSMKIDYSHADHSDVVEMAGKYLEGDTSAYIRAIEQSVDQFFDGKLSESELQAKYERLLKIELFGSAEAPSGPLTDEQKQAATDFYNEFRKKILSTAVERNNAEREQYLTGEMNTQRN